MKAVVVDDERLARRELRSLIQAHGGVDVVGEAASVQEAESLVEQLAPDLLFLDVEMPGANGFALLESVPSRTKIVFVTAHEEYAVRAFDVGAVDYLLKPVQPSRLALALGRAGPAEAVRLAYDERLLLPTDRHYRLVKVRLIAAIEADGDYSRVSLADGASFHVLRSLKEWEERLPDRHFVRIHRSAIVNLEHVERVEKWFNSSFRVHVRSRTEPLVSSRRCSAVLRAMVR